MSAEPNLLHSSRPVAAGTRIGHVHLKVADLDRALAFYEGVLGFQVTQRLAEDAAQSKTASRRGIVRFEQKYAT